MTRHSILAGVFLCAACGAAYGQDPFERFSYNVDDGGPPLSFIMSCDEAGTASDNPLDYGFRECAELETTRGPDPATHSVVQRAPDLAGHAGPIMQDIAKWFHGMGFRRIASETGNLKVLIHPTGITPTVTVFGAYVARTGSSKKHMWLYLDSALQQGEFKDNFKLTDTIAHELFHGVQFAYEQMVKTYVPPVESPKPNDWFMEATAVYVGGYYLQTKNATQPLNLFKERDYHQPLMDITNSSDEGYGTHAFYAALARRMSGDFASKGLRSLSLKPMNPTYLARVMEHIDQSSEKEFLDAFDNALAATGPTGTGLYRLYPEVMRDFAYGPDHDLKKPFPFVAGGKPFAISFAASDEPEFEAEDSVNEVATSFYVIDSDKLPEQERLLIEIEAAKGHEAQEQDLHLIVDGEQFGSKSFGDRNRMILRKTDKPAIIGVANVAQKASETKYARFKIRITRLEGGDCDYENIFSTTDFGEHRKAMVENGVPFEDVEELYNAMYPTPSRYLEDHGKPSRDGLKPPDIHPDVASFSISTQTMTAGGDACAHHLASSTLLEAELLGNPADLPSGDAQARDMAGDLTKMFKALGKSGKNKEPAFKSPTGRELRRVVRQMKGAFGWDARDGSVMVTVFSPNLYSFWQGHAAFPVEGPMIASRGGWGPKESAAVTLMLPGTRVKDLKAGRVYPAISVGAAMGGPFPILSRWAGTWTNRLGPEGTFDVIMPEKLSGFVRVEKVEGARVVASFELNGHGRHQRTLKFTEDVGGEEVMVEKNVSDSPTPIFISGEFKAPMVATGTLLYRNIFLQRSVSKIGK